MTQPFWRTMWMISVLALVGLSLFTPKDYTHETIKKNNNKLAKQMLKRFENARFEVDDATLIQPHCTHVWWYSTQLYDHILFFLHTHIQTHPIAVAQPQLLWNALIHWLFQSWSGSVLFYRGRAWDTELEHLNQGQSPRGNRPQLFWGFCVSLHCISSRPGMSMLLLLCHLLRIVLCPFIPAWQMPHPAN